VDRPRLLLIPEFTELEWELIAPRLRQWGEVASFDPPGVGEEPPAEKLDSHVVAGRALEELDRRGWDECFVVSDSWGIPSAARVAIARPRTVVGMALGHVKLSFRRDGERAPVNGSIYDAMVGLIRTDHEAFVRHGIAQSTGGSIGEDLAQRMIARVSLVVLMSRWEAITGEDEEIGALLSRVDCPLLFAKHLGCLGSTEEGFDDAAAAFPDARTVAVEDAPMSSEGFADAMRTFCEDVLATRI
jgi:hypothetical protein